MTIEVKVIADSIAETGRRITTMQLRYPRWIHSEFLTHRSLSRNSSSSRAIPIERLITDILRDMAMPLYWGSAKPGMQSGEEINRQVDVRFFTDYPGTILGTREDAWRKAGLQAIAAARAFDDAGYHKSIVNRLLEPFCHINTVVTATEWRNFFNLRCHPDAQPEIRILAELMRDAIRQSEPVRLKTASKAMAHDEWHLPYVSDEERAQHTVEECIKISVARCARVSFLTHDGKKPKADADLALYERLAGADPIHGSPLEHVATPDRLNPMSGSWMRPDLHGNAIGWRQWRKIVEEAL
jgi:thymidylate synthase ThyX